MKLYLHWLELRFALILVAGCTVLYMVIFYFFGDPVESQYTQEQVNYHLAKWILGTGSVTGWMVTVFCGSGLRNAWTERRLDGMVLPLTLPVSRSAIITSRIVFNSLISAAIILLVLLLMPVWHSNGLSVFDTSMSLNQLGLLFAWSTLFATGITILYMILVLVLNLFFFWAAWMMMPIVVLPLLIKSVASAVAASNTSWGSLLVALVAVIIASRLPVITAEKVEYA